MYKKAFSHPLLALSLSRTRTHELMLLKAQDIQQAGNGGGKERRERSAGSVRLMHPAAPRCGTAGAEPPAAGSGGGGRAGHRTRPGVKCFPFECRPSFLNVTTPTLGCGGAVLGAGAGVRRGPAPGGRCRRCRRRPAAGGVRGVISSETCYSTQFSAAVGSRGAVAE